MKTRIPILALAAAFVGCQDLAIVNPNLPDRDRATQQPVAAESFVASAFRTWWPVAGYDDYPSWAFSTMAREITSGFADFGQLETSAEPRTAWNNSPVNARSNVNVVPWAGLYRTISAVNDALIAIDSGLVIEDATRTARTQAVGKFIQGISHGYLALYFDQAYIVDEDLALDTITTPVFHPYQDVAAAAIAQLDEAIAIANASANFSLPVDGWLYQAMTRDQLVRLANSFVARIMVYSARTPAERAAVDWPAVIARIDAGIQTDFSPQAVPEILWHDWARLVARVRNAARPSDFGRPGYWLIGPADSTDGFVNWVNTPLNDRVAFQMVTKDRRIQGDGNPATPGSYMGYNLNNIFAASRGTWRYSWYFFRRYGTGTSWQDAQVPAMLVSEMNLLKAEGLIRTNQAALAVPLINLTRLANGQLPAVDVDGPPDEPGCVPRQLDGSCGSLWDALRYEKKMEGVGVSGVIAFFDARGWQELPENTLLHLPVPGEELATLRLTNYTFGGGGSGSAPVPAIGSCPAGVTLARCP
jgi:hypothetical protein